MPSQCKIHPFMNVWYHNSHTKGWCIIAFIICHTLMDAAVVKVYCLPHTNTFVNHSDIGGKFVLLYKSWTILCVEGRWLWGAVSSSVISSFPEGNISLYLWTTRQMASAATTRANLLSSSTITCGTDVTKLPSISAGENNKWWNCFGSMESSQQPCLLLPESSVTLLICINKLCAA